MCGLRDGELCVRGVVLEGFRRFLGRRWKRTEILSRRDDSSVAMASHVNCGLVEHSL